MNFLIFLIQILRTTESNKTSIGLGKGNLWGQIELRLTTLEIRRKRGDLIEFYKISNGLDSAERKNNLVKSCQENTDGPANNLRREGCSFTGSQLIYIKWGIKTVPLWNDLPVKVKEAKSLNGFTAGLDGLGLFEGGEWISFRLARYWRNFIYILIYYRTVKGCYSAVFTNAGLSETSHYYWYFL